MFRCRQAVHSLVGMAKSRCFSRATRRGALAGQDALVRTTVLFACRRRARQRQADHRRDAELVEGMGERR